MDGVRIVAENLIREAVEQGKFDNLPGKGGPLDLTRSPFEEPLAPTLRRILRDNGATHPLIEARRALEEEAAHLRARLESDWRAYRSSGIASQWERALEQFRGEVRRLNRQIKLNNLRADISNFHLRTLDAEAEILRVCSPDPHK
jgi:DnaJ family protein C protein 28